MRAIAQLCGGVRIGREFRAARRGGIGNLDVGEEAIAAARDGFYKAGTFGGIAEGLTDLVNHFVEAVVEIHEGVCGPKLFLKLLAGNHFAVVLEQDGQDPEGLFLKAHAEAMLAQFAGAEVHLENSETEPPTGLIGFFHGELKLSGRKCSTGRSLGKIRRGGFLPSLRSSESYTGTSIPARKNRASIVSISIAKESGACKSGGKMRRGLQGGFDVRASSGC